MEICLSFWNIFPAALPKGYTEIQKHVFINCSWKLLNQSIGVTLGREDIIEKDRHGM